MMYKQCQGFNGVRTDAILRISDYAMIPFVKENTDYQQFKLAATTGKNADGTTFQLEDSSGTVMTASQIQAFIATLP